jgi:hypothetical protein
MLKLFNFLSNTLLPRAVRALIVGLETTSPILKSKRTSTYENKNINPPSL